MAENEKSPVDPYLDDVVDVTKLEELPSTGWGNGFTMYADIEALGKQKKVARFRQFEFFCDEPPMIGGDDEYPQPLTYLAAGVGF